MKKIHSLLLATILVSTLLRGQPPPDAAVQFVLNGTISATYTTGLPAPTSGASDSNTGYAYICNYIDENGNAGNVAVIDLRNKGNLITTITGPSLVNPYAIVVSPTNGSGYFIDTDTFWEFNLTNYSLKNSLATDPTFAVALSEDNSTAYLLTGTDTAYSSSPPSLNLQVVDLGTFTITNTIPLTPSYQGSGETRCIPGSIAIASEIALVNCIVGTTTNALNSIIAIDLTSHTQINSITLADPPTSFYAVGQIAISGSSAYLCDYVADNVHVFNFSDSGVTDTGVSITGFNGPMGIASLNGHVYVTNFGVPFSTVDYSYYSFGSGTGNTVSVINPNTNTISSTITGFSSPLSIFTYSNNIYVTQYYLTLNWGTIGSSGGGGVSVSSGTLFRRNIGSYTRQSGMFR